MIIITSILASIIPSLVKSPAPFIAPNISAGLAVAETAALVSVSNSTTITEALEIVDSKFL